MIEFEEGEFRGPLFNQLEKGSHLLWEPGQVFEKVIGIDRASFCINDYLWDLHGRNAALDGVVLRNKQLSYIWDGGKPTKLLPDFKLNLFTQAKRSSYSSQSNTKLKPDILGPYWYFEVTPHQQLALDKLEEELSGEALVTYAAPVFHKQQELNDHTKNQTIICNSTFPKASTLKNHTKWYFDKAGIIGVANPDFEFISEENLINQIQSKRTEFGNYNDDVLVDNLHKISEAVQTVVKTRPNEVISSRFNSYSDTIDSRINYYGLRGTKGLKEIMQVETFIYLWELNWLTF